MTLLTRRRSTRTRFPIRVNVLAGSTGTLASDRGLEVVGVAGGLVNFTNVHLQAGSVLTAQQQVDTSIQVGGTLDGDAAIRNVDDGRVVVKDFAGPFNLMLFTDANKRATVLNGNVTTNKLLVGAGGTANGRVNLETGANLPAVELASNGTLAVAAGQTGTVASINSTNADAAAIDVSGVLQIRPAASAAASTTSKVASLAIAGATRRPARWTWGAGNRLAIDYAAGSSPITTVRNQIVAAFNSGWAGPGLTTSAGGRQRRAGGRLRRGVGGAGCDGRAVRNGHRGRATPSWFAARSPATRRWTARSTSTTW